MDSSFSEYQIQGAHCIQFKSGDVRRYFFFFTFVDIVLCFLYEEGEEKTNSKEIESVI